MSAIKLALLEYAIRALLGADWTAIRSWVQVFMEEDLPSEVKKQRVIKRLREGGSEAATWLLSAAIDVAYGLVVRRITRK